MTRASRSFSDAGFPSEIQQVLGSFLIFWSEYPYNLCLLNKSYECLWILSETFPSDRQFQIKWKINGILFRWYVYSTYGVFTLAYVPLPVLHIHSYDTQLACCLRMLQLVSDPTDLRTQFDSTLTWFPNTSLIIKINYNEREIDFRFIRVTGLTQQL
jgi:hypothetical protein